MKLSNEIAVSLWKVKTVGWICTLFFTFCLVGSFFSEERFVSIFFLPFILIGIILLANAGKIHANGEKLMLNAPIGRYEMALDEIESIEHGQSTLVFISNKKRLTIPLPAWWGKTNKKEMIAIIDAALKTSEIKPKQTFRADYLFNKGTRVAK